MGSRFNVTNGETIVAGIFSWRAPWENIQCTPAIYAPNHDQATFLSDTLHKLKVFAQGCIILAGDINVPLEPQLDTSQGTSSISQKHLTLICKHLHDAQLMDIWRVLHPKDKDWSHFSHIHHSYSRIDYIFIDHHHLDLLYPAKIEVSTLSDHAPITIRLTLPLLPRRVNSWKLNDSLLKDVVNKTQIEVDLVILMKIQPPTSRLACSGRVIKLTSGASSLNWAHGGKRRGFSNSPLLSTTSRL